MKSVTRVLLSTTCITGLLLVPAIAQAQDAAATTTSVATGSDDGVDTSEGIVVTGSRINRPNSTAAAPITSVTSDAIHAQAAVNIEEVLNRMPQIAPDSQQGYQDSDGRQRIKLRNLGFERTLVLVDGKRLGTMNGEDVGMIPTALIKQVDVLTGGASAVYGSDAVAGVVNFIMDDDFQGVQLNANYNFYLHNNKAGIVSKTAAAYGFDQPATGMTADGGRADISLTAGTKLFDDRLHISGYVDYRKASLVRYSQRETSGCQLAQTGDGPLSCTTSSYTPLGYVSPLSGANAGNTYVNNPDGSGTFLPYSDEYAANPYDGYSLQRADQRVNAGGFLKYEISDAATIYANAMWFHDKSTNPYPARIYSYTAFGSDPYQISCNNPLLSASQATTLCGSAAGTNTTVPTELRYRLGNVSDLDDVYINDGLRISGGVRGDIGHGWSYDVGGVYAHNKNQYQWAMPSWTRLNQALDVVQNSDGSYACASGVSGCLPLDPFNANSSLNTQAAFDWVAAGQYEKWTTTTSLYDAIGTLQGDLGTYGIKSPWADDGIAIAVSGEYRKDTLQGRYNDVWVEYNGGTDSNLAQSVWEGMVELQAPVIEHKPFADLLQFNGAYRVSKYSSNPSAFSTWKFEAVWSPIHDITLRGSINRAQRAPTVVEQSQASNSSYGRVTTAFSDFCAPTVTYTTGADGQQVPVYGAPVASEAVCAATGLSADKYGSATLLCPTDVGCTYKSGGFTVDPETAYTKTIGVVLRPSFLPGLTVSADRFMIDLNDSIGYNDYSYFANGCLATASDFFCSMFVRNSDGTLYSDPATNPTSGYIRQGTTNYYKSKSHGWDFQAQYALPLGRAGKLDFDFAGSLTTLAGGQDSPILAKYNCAGYYGGSCGQLIPKWSHTLRTTYTTDDKFFSASLNWRFIGPLTNVTNSGKTSLGWSEATERTTYYHIPAYNYFDLALAFRVTEKYSLRFSVNNLFDKAPPIVPNSYNYALSRNNTLSARYDSLGRQVAVSTTVNF
ncbi:TonB-dependent receptor domain-containing protein [Novosphingobium sp. 9]|uniref:TonB-dependent receptor domain-containing protein n=1 Tax=Novosphingobium sp. 9 TaxID=2025349 RepID=UPI0021B68DEA|nr:TonB-dependent receptor [Novosphingobium sp. 9]